MFGFFLFLVLLFNAPFSHGAVDPKSGGYSHSWLDLQDPENSQVGVRRTYNSKSSRVGIFGMGQCSEFETALSLEENGNVALIHCGSGQVRIFSSQQQKTLSQLIKAYKESIPNFSERAFRKDHFYRISILELSPRMARPDRIPPQKYRSVEGDATMVATRNSVTVDLEDGTTYVFSSEGQLRSISDFDKSYKISYYENRPTKISTENKSMVFKYNSNGLVSSITGDLRGTASYTYNGLYMRSATNGWGNVYGFKYNSKGNLATVIYPDGTRKKLRYDSKEKVVEFVGRKGCKESYSYSKEGAYTEVFGVIKVCKGKEVVRATSKNTYSPDKTGYLRLASNLKTVNGKQTESVFDLKTGELIKRSKQGALDKSEKTIREYKYKKTRKGQKSQVRKVTVKTRTVAGKQASTTTENFKLNAANKVISFQNARGDKVSAKYNSQGLIQSLVGKKQPRIDLQYDSYRRPVSISIKGKGKLRLKYEGTGVRSLEVVEGSEKFTAALGTALKRYDKFLKLR